MKASEITQKSIDMIQTLIDNFQQYNGEFNRGQIDGMEYAIRMLKNDLKYFKNTGQ